MEKGPYSPGGKNSRGEINPKGRKRKGNSVSRGKEGVSDHGLKGEKHYERRGGSGVGNGEGRELSSLDEKRRCGEKGGGSLLLSHQERGEED